MAAVVGRAGHRFVGGVAANGNVADAEATLELARDPANGLVMVEGLNEPNTNFGSGEVPPQMTKDIQDCLWKNKLPGIPVVGPCIVFGLPYPEGYITPGYCSAEDIAYLNARMDIIAGHFYPPNVCDLDGGANRDGCVRRRGHRAAQGLRQRQADSDDRVADDAIWSATAPTTIWMATTRRGSCCRRGGSKSTA